MESSVLETPSDRYVIRQFIAEGGMGAIYLGKKLGVGGFEKDVVFKQLLPDYTRDHKFIELFLREARISAALDHANIVQTIDLVSAGDDFFIVMEYVHGSDLRSLLRRLKLRGQQFSLQAGLYIGHAILDALNYAHKRRTADGKALGLIHRDISPSNILISHTGEVKLTDFGIAKAATQRSVMYRVKGKVGYMSPEQARGEKVDHRSDLFSFAVCLYEVLVGERLFVADLLSTPSMIYSQPIPKPSEVRAGLPRELDAVMARALALDPKARFQSAEELQDALAKISYLHGPRYSSSDMGSHLLTVCGDVDQWRECEGGGSVTSGTQAIADGGEEGAVRSAVTLLSTSVELDSDGTPRESDRGRSAEKSAPSHVTGEAIRAFISMIENLDDEPPKVDGREPSAGMSTPSRAPRPATGKQPVAAMSAGINGHGRSQARERVDTAPTARHASKDPPTVKRIPTGQTPAIRKTPTQPRLRAERQSGLIEPMAPATTPAPSPQERASAPRERLRPTGPVEAAHAPVRIRDDEPTTSYVPRQRSRSEEHAPRRTPTSGRSISSSLAAAGDAATTSADASTRREAYPPAHPNDVEESGTPSSASRVVVMALSLIFLVLTAMVIALLWTSPEPEGDEDSLQIDSLSLQRFAPRRSATSEL